MAHGSWNRSDGVAIEPVTPDRWNDVLELFGDNGAYSNCWCTWWLLSASGWDDATPTERRRRLCDEVASGWQPGLLALQDGGPIGWCAVGPRHRYDRLNSRRSRVYRPIDDLDTWVVNCFFIRKDRRGEGVARVLLEAAVAHARANGATVVEGYPIDRDARRASSPDLFVGTLSMFTAAGFTEVARMGTRPLVRKYLEATASS